MKKMKVKTRTIVEWAIIILVVVVSIVLFILSGYKKDIGPCTEYNCDVKNFRLTTKISVSKGDEEFAKISGKLKFVTDPLTMYDLNDKKIAFADDSYHFISQDSHTICFDDENLEMVGKVKFFGEEYDIYKNNQKIATATFNSFNTSGTIVDTEGNLLADFTSRFLFKDFDVRITENCNLDDKAILMICASYYSDYDADSKSSKKSNND